MVWGVQAAQSAEQHSERMSGGLLGGYKEVSTSDQEVTEAANFAAEQLSQRSNSLYPFKVKEVRLCAFVCIHCQGLALQLHRRFQHEHRLVLNVLDVQGHSCSLIRLSLTALLQCAEVLDCCCRCCRPRPRWQTARSLTWL